MAPLIRCPHCDTFVKTASLSDDSCPFCPAANAARNRNPIPGLVLAATIAAMPACSHEPKPSPVAQPENTNRKDAAQPQVPSPQPEATIYGIAPSMEKIEQPKPEPIKAVPSEDVDIYGIAPEPVEPSVKKAPQPKTTPTKRGRPIDKNVPMYGIAPD